MSLDNLTTAISRDFAGRRRRFQLRIGELRELESECKAGVGEILRRLASHQWTVADIRETVRLGLLGGSQAGETSEADVYRLTKYYVDERPIGENLQLAVDVLNAALVGVPPGNADGEAATGSTSDAPATSSPSTGPADPSGSTLE